MSLIIKGMDMPKRGEYLHLEIYPNGLVWGDNGHEWVKHEAQAIEIPTPHGRLIDYDRLIDYTSKVSLAESFAEICYPATILEAEE